MEEAFVSWSGGKDSCLALYRAVSSGMRIRFLLNMLNEDGQRSRSHGISAQWLRLQARAIGIPIIQKRTTGNDYETQFKDTVLSLKQRGLSAGVFGDIDFEEHRQWIERVCSETGIKSYLPLWKENQKKILQDFINSCFAAVVVATKADVMNEEWLGRKLDRDFIRDLAKLEQVTPCGEAGEYHTLVIDGPLFRKRLEIIVANRVFRDGHCFLEITKCKLGQKRTDGE